MGLQLSVTVEAILNKGNITPSLIVEIEGFDFLFGTVKVVKQAKVGDFIIGDGTKIGGGVTDESSKDWVSFTGTTNNISQDINIDRAEGNSITSFKVQFIDKNDAATRVFSPSFQVNDILGKESKVYFMPVGGVFPKDANAIFLGIIDNIEFGAGNVSINIAHPNQLNRQDLLPKYTTKLSAAINNSTTTIPVDTVIGILTDQNALTTYVKIDDEIIKLGPISENSFTGCTRAQLNTVANSHDDNADVESFYRLQGNSIELALKMMISGVGDYGSESATRFQQIDALTNIPNAIFFTEFNIAEKMGITIGDFVSTTGATNGANNVTNREIVEIQQTDSGSYVVVDGVALADETDSVAVATFKNKYDVLNFGCAIKPYHIDVEQYKNIDRYFSSAFIEYDFYIKDTINAKEFLDKEVYFPSAIYSIPRKGKISINYSAPPLAIDDVKILNADNVKKPSNIRIKRTTNQKFYNAIVFKYEQDSLEDKFLKGLVTQSADSTNRIKVGNKILTIETKGSRNNGATNTAFETISRRLLDRYRYGAEFMSLDVNFATGYPIDIGDPVIIEGASLRLSDSKTGSRDFSPRVMEVTNKTINLKTGEISLECTDTIYGTDGRYGVIAPSSYVGVSSTTTEIKLKETQLTITTERAKWARYIGTKIKIRSADFTYSEFTTIISISDTTEKITVSALPAPPLEDYIIEVANYDEELEKDLRYSKGVHCFFTPQTDVVGYSNPSIEVSALDIGKFFINCIVQIHNEDFSDSHKTKVSGISGNFIELLAQPTFTPDNTYKIDYIGFSFDNGKPYLLY